MIDINDRNSSATNTLLLKNLGAFIKQQRITQNKSQSVLAEEAGISRSALAEFENGANTTLLTFIQLLRALQLLAVLKYFETEKQISPLQLAKMQERERKRASKTNRPPSQKSDW